MKTIITGITGQDGSHLADLLIDKGYEVVGVTRRSSVDNTHRIKHLLNHERFKLVEGDITDVSSVINIFKDNDDVDEIYNLAAQSHVGSSFRQPGLTWDVTGKGCINLLQSIVDLGMENVRFYQASSSEMFGSSYDTSNGVKYQDENTKFMPNSPYAIAKCAAHYAVRLYRDAYGLHASSGILFNHEGPRRGENFVTQKIIRWVADFVKWERKNGNKELSFMKDHIVCNGNTFPKLRLGNIEAHRDWGYAGDYVEAMWLMLQQEKADDYVICTGKTYSVKDFLELAFKEAGIINDEVADGELVRNSDWKKYIVIDQAFYRPSEVDYLRGRSSKASRALGWKPKTDLYGLVKMMLDAKF